MNPSTQVQHDCADVRKRVRDDPTAWHELRSENNRFGNSREVGKELRDPTWHETEAGFNGDQSRGLTISENCTQRDPVRRDSNSESWFCKISKIHDAYKDQ